MCPAGAVAVGKDIVSGENMIARCCRRKFICGWSRNVKGRGVKSDHFRQFPSNSKILVKELN